MVRRLRAAGAIVIGKTHLPELAIYGFTESATWGVTRNPWNPQRSTGGSSGGSAAAVAAGMVPLASASDGAGSIRIPAASCGLFGLKPQRGRISLAPDLRALERDVGQRLRQPHRARHGALPRHHQRRLAGAGRPGRRPSAPSPSRRGPRPASCGSRPRPKPPRRSLRRIVGDEVKRAVAETGEPAASLGHEVAERDPDWGQVGNNFSARYLRGIHDDVERVPFPSGSSGARAASAASAGCSPTALLERARRAAAEDAARINALFDEFDVLMTPVMGGTAIPVRSGRAAARCGRCSRSVALLCFTPAGTTSATRRPRSPPGSPPTGCRSRCS